MGRIHDALRRAQEKRDELEAQAQAAAAAPREEGPRELVDDLSAVCLIVLLLGAASKLPRRIAGVFPWVLTGIMGTYIISNDLYFAFYRGYLSPAALAHTGDAGRAAPSALSLSDT